MSGFLDNMPDVDLPGGRKRSRSVRPKAKATAINTGADIRTVIWHVIKCPFCGAKLEAAEAKGGE